MTHLLGGVLFGVVSTELIVTQMARILYDYKTGTAPQINAMVEGKDVQIATYLLAAQNILPQGRNVGPPITSSAIEVGRAFSTRITHRLGVTKGKTSSMSRSSLQNHKFAEILQGYIRSILEGRFPSNQQSKNMQLCAFQASAGRRRDSNVLDPTPSQWKAITTTDQRLR